MKAHLFRAFIKAATGMVPLPQYPEDYSAVRALAMQKLAFPQALGHAMEVGGLGILARPTIQEARGQEVSERSKRMHELGGLGVLAVPSAVELGQHFAPKIKSVFQRARQLHLPGVA